MDDATIQKIAAEIVAHLPTYSWTLLLVQSVLIAVVAAIAVFASEYLRARGRNFATRADFESLQKQLSANTELVENIKAEVGQRDWAKREWTNLRRMKLEALLDKMHECDEYLEQHRSDSIAAKVPVLRDPASEMDTIQTLYFPELAVEVGDFVKIFREQIAAGAHFTLELTRAGQDVSARGRAIDEFERRYNSASFELRLRAIQAVKTSARRLLLGVMSVA